MNATVENLRGTIIPRSDQLNTDQLLGGPMVITVTEVRVGGSVEQPVTIHYEGDNGRPYRPCLTMRKVLVLAWGPDGTTWPGKSIELYADPSVRFGGEVVGGIRISRLSDIPKDIKVSLTATKGRKSLHEIRPLVASRELTAALAAIASATGREGMQKARAMAEALEDASDIAAARAAYQKKAADLKASAAAPKTFTPVIHPEDNREAGADPPSPVDPEQVLTLIRGARNAAQLRTAAALIDKLSDAIDIAKCNGELQRREAELTAAA